MNNIKKIGKTTIIYLLGNVLTRVVGFLLIRVYTNHIMPPELGEYDINISYITLLSSVLFLDIWNVIMKFYFKKTGKTNKKNIVDNGLLIFILSTILFVLFFIAFDYKLNFQYKILLFTYGLLISIQNLFGYMARMLGYNKKFVISGLISSIINFSAIFLLLKFFNFNYDALYIGFILGVLTQVFYLYFYVRKEIKLNKIKFEKDTFLMLLKFSLPLAINSLAYWFLTNFGKIYISEKLGKDAIGLYSISLKFTTIITLVSTAFTMAWQEFSFNLHEKNDENIKFYNNFSKYFIEALLVSSILILVFINIIYPFMVSDSYLDAKNFIPYFLISTIFSILSTFLGTIILTFNLSAWISISTIIAAVINVVLSVILVNYLKAYTFPIVLGMSWFINSSIRIMIINKEFRYMPFSFNMIFYLIMYFVAVLIFNDNNNIMLIIMFTILVIYSTIFYGIKIKKLYEVKKLEQKN